MILLIDDSDNERALIRKMLESGGHDVREAASGDEGLTLFGTLRPDLVICDLMMPLKDGFATIADMQSLASDAKIIAMSGVWFGKTDHAAMAENLGLVAVIEKPFERTPLLKLVTNTLTPPKPRAKRRPKRTPKAKRKTKSKPARKVIRRGKPKAKRKR
jgi:DNA-binding response OmpR family regulator